MHKIRKMAHRRSRTTIAYRKKTPGLQLPQLLGVSLRWNRNDIDLDSESIGVVKLDWMEVKLFPMASP